MKKALSLVCALWMLGTMAACGGSQTNLCPVSNLSTSVQTLEVAAATDSDVETISAKSSAADVMEQTTPAKDRRPVEIIFQNPELPNGCEVTSLAMLLSSVDGPVDKLTLYRDYLPSAGFSYINSRRYGPDPESWYVGDAADPGGWYCFEGPVVQAANEWLADHESSLCAVTVTGLNQKELDRYAQAEVPLVVWVTLGYAAPAYSKYSWKLEDGTTYYPYSNLHCVVLAGAQDGQYKIADPINGFSLVDRDVFWNSFSAMGSRAVAIEQVYGSYQPLVN